MEKEMSLMIVDDEQRFLITTGKLISRLGYSVQTAAGGPEALEKLLNHEVHVVILDVKMPGMDGIDTLRAIKRQNPIIEVIMLTGHGTMEAAIEGMKNGASDFLLKPIDISELIGKAEAAYRRRRDLQGRIKGVLMRRTSAPQDE